MPIRKEEKEHFFQTHVLGSSSSSSQLGFYAYRKNVSKNILGTLLGIEKKIKDTLQSHVDRKDLNIGNKLHPLEVRGKVYIPPACFTLSMKENKEFISLLTYV